MSSKLPILLALVGVAYFITTASGEEGDDVVGCMDATACNYDDTVIQEDGSCEYPEENYDCNGNCIAAIDCNYE